MSVPQRTIILMMFLIATVLVVPVLAQEYIGVVTAIEGVADVARTGSDITALKENDKIFTGDRLRTKRYSKLEISFVDKSSVRFAPETCVTVDKYDTDASSKRLDARLMLTRGKVEAIVAKTGAPDTFKVLTPNAVGSVKGSDIFVFYQGGKTGVLVKDGLMTLANQADLAEKIAVAEGDFSSVAKADVPSEARRFMGAELSLHTKDVLPAMSKKIISGEDASQMPANVAKMAGTVRVFKSGASDWRPAILSENLVEGDKLQTSADGWVEILLGNGNQILLNADSELSIVILKFDAKTGNFDNTFESSKGKIKSVISKLGKESTFQIKTPTAVCGARGTVMMLDVSGSGTQAFYEGGAGYVTSTVTGDTQELAPGQNTSVDLSGSIETPEFTSNEQSAEVNDSFSPDNGALDGASDSSGLSEAGAGVSADLNLSSSGQAEQLSEALAAEGIGVTADMITFDEAVLSITPDDTTTTTPTELYNVELPYYQASATVFPYSMDLQIFDDYTWSATITGTVAVDVPGSTDLEFISSDLPTSPLNQITLVARTDDGQTFVKDSVPVGWTSVSVVGFSESEASGKDLSGTATGTFSYDSTTDQNVMTGSASGTWVQSGLSG